MSKALAIDFAFLFACCIVGNAMVALMYRHLKRNHPTIWDSLQFPGGNAYPGAALEKEQARATLRHLMFIWSAKRRLLNDRYYNTLAVVFNLMLVGTATTMIIFVALAFHRK